MAAESRIRSAVRDHYSRQALRVLGGTGSACCGSSGTCSDPITSDLYEADVAAGLPGAALEASLGCGNPTALLALAEGEVVLDLGSGGGIDVILSARRVGASGKVYGLDMTDEMLDLARRNAVEAGVENVEFLRGEIEAIPLPAESVDVIISNCVINLSEDKPRVLREAFRVLKPGGRFAISDVVVRGTISEELRTSLDHWAGCVGGALEEDEYLQLLRGAGFESVEIEPTRIYDNAELTQLFGEGSGSGENPEFGGQLMSASVRAARPAAVEGSCCSSECCT